MSTPFGFGHSRRLAQEVSPDENFASPAARRQTGRVFMP
jgi:hypothetical protein